MRAATTRQDPTHASEPVTVPGATGTLTGSLSGALCAATAGRVNAPAPAPALAAPKERTPFGGRGWRAMRRLSSRRSAHEERQHRGARGQLRDRPAL